MKIKIILTYFLPILLIQVPGKSVLHSRKFYMKDKSRDIWEKKALNIFPLLYCFCNSLFKIFTKLSLIWLIAFYQNSKQPFSWEIIHLSQLSSRLLLIHSIWRGVIHFSIHTLFISYIEKVICLSYFSWKHTKKFNCKNCSNEDLRCKKWQPFV